MYTLISERVRRGKANVTFMWVKKVTTGNAAQLVADYDDPGDAQRYHLLYLNILQ